MTGELGLTGEVMPIGGVREKVIAGRRVGIKNLILPVDNKKDFLELPPILKRGIRVHYVANYTEVVKLVFGETKT